MPRLKGQFGLSRKGSPAIGLQKIIDRLAGKATKKGRIRRKMAAVSVEDAEDAADTLKRSRGMGARFRDAAVVGGVTNPLVQAVGRAAEGFASKGSKGKRLAEAGKGFMNSHRGEVAKHVTMGALGGAAINAGREGMQTQRAKRTAENFLLDDAKAKYQPPQKLAESLELLGLKLKPVRPAPLTPISHNESEYEI